MCSFVVPDAKQFGIKKIQVDEQIGIMQNWLEQGTDIVQVYARHFQVNIRNEFAIAESTSPFRSKDHDKVEPR